MLGHQGRNIHLMGMDCKGCEYDILNQLACNVDSHFVEQFMVEFHWQKSFGLMSDDDSLVFTKKALIGGDAIRRAWGKSCKS